MAEKSSPKIFGRFKTPKNTHTADDFGPFFPFSPILAPGSQLTIERKGIIPQKEKTPQRIHKNSIVDSQRVFNPQKYEASIPFFPILEK